MRVLIATDAWHPQVNGVVRTLTSLAEERQGASASAIEFLTPEGFLLGPAADLSEPAPGAAEPRARSRAASTAAQPDAIHIATEGPIGFMARAYCLRRGLPFTTSYTTRFPEYIAARVADPGVVELRGAAPLPCRRRGDDGVDAVADGRAAPRGFQNLGMWTRGVDTELFAPERAVPLDLPRPIFLTAGRVAVEKNLEAFLSLDLPGSKVVVGEGPQETELRRRFPDAKFLGLRKGQSWPALIAAADVFVFPSLTDTFGVVQLEALACGVPVAAFPVTGPKDVIGDRRSACSTTICAPHASPRSKFRARPAAPSR